MLELSSTTDASQPSDPSPSEKRLSLWEKPTAVALLSLVFPGLGQVINREPGKGVGFAASGPLLAFLGARSGLFQTFRGFAGVVAVQVIWHVWICVDAFRVARQRNRESASVSYSFGVLGLCGCVVLAISIFAATDYFAHLSINFKAFKASTDSFCPTLCVGERFVVNRDGFRVDQPRRGDVVAFDFHGQHGPVYIKRIAALAGDVVSEKDGSVFINGAAYAPSVSTQNCGQALKPQTNVGENLHFSPVAVPPDSFFVIGDNLRNSFDSRVEGFGFVTPNQVVGKAMFIYWSPEHSRIGCKIE
jgi:signal peptidase I